MSQSSRPLAVLSIVVAGVLIAASVVAGLRLPATATFAAFPPASSLDYDSSFRGKVAPLRDAFVREVLDGGGPSALGGRVGRRTPGGALDDLSDPFGAQRVHDPHPFVNDDMADARAIGAIPFTGRTNTTTATRERNEAEGCGGRGGTAWYRYASGRAEEVIANSFGTDYAVSIGVYALAPSGALDFIDCDLDFTGNALVQIPAEAGRTYLFQITAETTGGALVFTLEPGGRTELISETPGGKQASGQSLDPSISANGRYVAFLSYADDLVPGAPTEPCATRTTPPRSFEEIYGNVDPVFPCGQIYAADRAGGTLRIASVSSIGAFGNGGSGSPSLSGDGRFVAFVSTATNLVPFDTNGAADVFVHDVVIGRTERVSVTSSGDQLRPAVLGSVPSVQSPDLSNDGRFVVFESEASNLVRGDTNNMTDVFVHDRRTGRTERVSVTSDERQAHGPLAADERANDEYTSYASPSISAGGRYVVFLSTATNLDPRDTNGAPDVFLRDRRTGTTELISSSLSGKSGNAGATGRPAASADGRYVMFLSGSSDLVAGDHNGMTDVFVRDRGLGRTLRASVSSSGVEADRDSFAPTMSQNGRYVVYNSTSTVLAPGSRGVEGGPSCRFVFLSPTCPEDIYVHDLVTRTTIRLPVAPSGPAGEATARNGAVSADGATIAFYSGCFDCVPGLAEVWVHDRRRRPS